MLPTKEQLFYSPETIPLTPLQELLASEPNSEWVRKERDEDSGNKYEYLPIERLEFLMRSIFGSYKIEVKNSHISPMNSVVTVRVHYTSPDPTEGDPFSDVSECFADGIGGSKGIPRIAVAIAKANAFKNAVKSIGNIFGQNLSRNDELPVISDKNLATAPEIKHQISCCETIEELDIYKASLSVLTPIMQGWFTNRFKEISQ